MLPLPWREALFVAAAVAVQAAYSSLYHSFGGISWKEILGDWAAEPAASREAVEVREFLSPRCEGAAARLWHIPPSAPGTCVAIRPRMKTPGAQGQGVRSVAAESLYGRVSCADLRHPGGGFVELCEDETCDAGSCMKVGVVGEGECGVSFTGFAAASWRCIPEGEMPEVD